MSLRARVALVVAAARNGVIGREGALPWRLSSDLKRFRALTMGKAVIMGRKTFASIGKPLDGRDNIVLTRQSDFHAAGVHIVASVDAALALAQRLATERDAAEIMIAGGSEIYAAFMPWVERIYLTRVEADVAGDATFTFDPALWRETERTSMLRTDKDAYDATFLTLDRAAVLGAGSGHG